MRRRAEGGSRLELSPRDFLSDRPARAATSPPSGHGFNAFAPRALKPRSRFMKASSM
jgi:hypothetical protein